MPYFFYGLKHMSPSRVTGEPAFIYMRAKYRLPASSRDEGEAYGQKGR